MADGTALVRSSCDNTQIRVVEISVVVVNLFNIVTAKMCVNLELYSWCYVAYVAVCMLYGRLVN